MNKEAEPNLDVAHLGHIEVLTPNPESSLNCLVEVLGLEPVRVIGNSVYLRSWSDYDVHTIKLTASENAGLGHVGWRCRSQQALERRAEALRAVGAALNWVADDGHGPALQFHDPEGHLMEIYYESEKYVATEERFRSRLLNQPMRYSGRGISPQRLDHLSLQCRDVTPNREFLQAQLGFRVREQVLLDDNVEEGALLGVTHQVHDLSYTRNVNSSSGRQLHHIAFWLEERTDILRAADILRENDVPIEVGPARRNVSATMFLYFIEPGGNRIELISGGYSVYAPDFKTVIWTNETRGNAIYWGGSSVTKWWK
jgi:catechol 2,3-dioxygenase